MTSWEIHERDDHVGGLASSYEDPQGFIWDHGGHVMFSHYAYFDDLVEKMLQGDYDEHMREAWVWLHGRFVPYPFQNNIHRLPRDVFLDCIMGIIEAQRTEMPKGDFGEYIAAVFGEGIADHFMRPYNFKVWAHPLDMMSTSWQGDRVPTVDVRRILENLVDDRADVSWGPNNMFKFPLLGTGMLYERIAASLPQPVNFDKNVTEVDVDRRTVTFADGSVTAYDSLVNTMPLTELIPRIPQSPPEVRAALDGLHHTSGMFIGIGVKDPCPSTKCWMYFPGDDSPFYRVTYLSNYSPKMTPGPGHFSLLAEVSASPYKVEDPDTVIDRTIEGMIASELLTQEQADTKIVSRELMQVQVLIPCADDRSRRRLGSHPAMARQSRDLLPRAVRRVALRDRQHRSLGDDGRGDRRSPGVRGPRDHVGAPPWGRSPGRHLVNVILLCGASLTCAPSSSRTAAGPLPQ